jgi:hypothetical protein
MGETPTTSDEQIVQRNFGLTATQDEWLRERAHVERRPKAELVRDAVGEYMTAHPKPSNAT